MRINNLNLENFRSHKDTSIDLDQVNVFVGRNGSGKTSIKDAIQYALTGKNRLTDGRGSGAEIMINWEAKISNIKLDLNSIGEVHRRIPNKLQVADWSGNKTAQENELLRQLGVDERVIVAVLNSYDFVKMDSSDQKNLIFDLAGLRFDKDKVIEKYIKWNQGEIDKAAKLLEKELDDNLQGSGEVFDDIYKQVYKLRREAKKEKAAVEGEINKLPDVELPEGVSLNDKNTIEKQFDELNKKRDELVKVQGLTESKLSKKSKLEKRQEEIKSDLKEKKEALEEIDSDFSQINDLNEELEKLENKLDELEQEKSDLKEKKATLSGEIKGKKQAIEALKREDNACPLAPEHVQCPMTDKEINNLIEKIEESMDQEALDSLEKEISNIKGEIDTLEEGIKTTKKSLEENQERYRNYEDLKKEVEQLEKEQEKVENELDSIGEIKDPDELQEEINKLDDRIEKGRKLVDKLSNYKDKEDKWNDLNEDLAEAEAKVEALERLVTAFKPEGIKNGLISELIEPIEKEANNKLAELTDGLFSVKFDLEGDYFVQVKKDNWPRWAPIKVLSTSEKLRLGVVMQHVLNNLTDLKFMVIDEADTLEPQNKSLLVNTVLKIKEDYDQIMILSTVGENKPHDPGIEGLKTFWVENGRVKDL